MGPNPTRIFSGIETSPALVVAVSGGSDSLALLLLLHEAFAESGPRLLAVTIDHRLRPEAAAEAESVTALCHSLGIEHRTMTWDGEKPGTGVIAAAREARYDLLAEAAHEIGADIILTGHTMNDQAETVAMRMKRGDGAGLAGMATATLFDGSVWIVRPLLKTRRQALREFLRARNVRWADDPTNDNPAYERVRIRKALDDGRIAGLATRADSEGRQRTQLAEAAGAFVAQHVIQPSPGLFRIDPDAMRGADTASIVHALRALLATTGGTSHLPDLTRSKIMFERLQMAMPLRATLSRAVVDARKNGIWIRREARDVPTLVLSSEAAIWDGRWRIQGGDGQLTAPLGQEHAKSVVVELKDVPESLAAAALAMEPALFSQGDYIGLADGPEASRRGFRARRVVAPFARFLPAFDLSLAAALARLLGVAEPPLPPWKHHIAPEA